MTLRFGIVGAGGIAQSYARVFAGLTSAEVVAVVDRDPEAAQRLATTVGAVTAGSLAELVARADVDAVIVCTPPDAHPQIALDAIRAGKAVLCEKPLAITVASARRMVAASVSAGVPFTMATKFRFVDDVLAAQSIVESGVLGDLIQLENSFASRVDMSDRWNSVRAISGGGVLIDNGTHSVDIARYFLGPIREVMAIEGPRTLGLDVEDSVQVLVRADSGATATIDLSWSYDNATDSYLQLYGRDGALRVGWRESAYRENGSEDWIRFGSGYDKVTCMRRQVENFCAALLGLEPLAITAADGVASVQVIAAAYESLAVGDWVAVDAVQVVESAEDVA